MSSLILFKISCLLYSGEYSGNLGGLLFISVSSCIYSHCIKLIIFFILNNKMQIYYEKLIYINL